MPSLMLKDKEVISLKFNDDKSFHVLKVVAPELLPVILQKDASDEAFNKWMKIRSIPDTRDGLKDVLARFGESCVKGDVGTSFASLTDQYWIRWRDESWRKINFFTNRYNSDLGDAFFVPWKIKRNKLQINSPDLTTNGILKKCWRQHPQTKLSKLYKAGCKAAHQDPMNEVLASAMGEQIEQIPVVHYDLCCEGVTLCDSSDNFITQDTELVPASYFYGHTPRADGESIYGHLIKACEAQDIPDAAKYINWMIFLDNYIGNEDRNIGNIGFIRDVNTLKYIGPAPVYDFGNAYWDIRKVTDFTCSKNFGNEEKAIFQKMLRKANLKFTKQTFYESAINNYPYFTDKRKEALIEAIKKKNQMLQNEMVLMDKGER